MSLGIAIMKILNVNHYKMEGEHGPGKCSCHAIAQDLDPMGEDLLPWVNTDHIYCLNERIHDSCKKVFRAKDQKLESNEYLESNDDDPELLLNIPFTCPVKLKSVCIIGSEAGMPLRVRLYKNIEHADFGNIEGRTPDQTIELHLNPTGEIEYPTRISKFSNTNSLQMHFPDSYGGEMIQISYIGLKGEHTGYKREAVVTIYESRPVPKDNCVEDKLKNMQDIA